MGITTDKSCLLVITAGLAVVVLSIYSCQSQKSLPGEKLRQFEMSVETSMENDTLFLDLDNPLYCPLSISFKSSSAAFSEQLNTLFPIVLAPLSDTQLVVLTTIPKSELGLTMSSTFGNPDYDTQDQVFAYPFPRGRKYRVIQAYNGGFSHNSDYSRYAIDFSLAIGDTICAAAGGYVVGVIEGYKEGGNTREWRDYANYITLYHPVSNLFTQYVHLDHQGSLVEIGDKIHIGQAIGISGNTGFTDSPHLHFNVLKTGSDGLLSTPVNFQDGVKGSNLMKGTSVYH